MYEWMNVTDGMPDIKLINQGTCQLAMKRLGGYSSSLGDLLVVRLSESLSPKALASEPSLVHLSNTLTSSPTYKM